MEIQKIIDKLFNTEIKEQTCKMSTGEIILCAKSIHKLVK